MCVGNFREIISSVNERYIIIRKLVVVPSDDDDENSATADKYKVTSWRLPAIKAQGIRLT
jgi:hypothetical protein